MRTLLVFVTLCAIPCSWLSVKMKQARREHEAAATLQMKGAKVEWSKPAGPPWLRTILGSHPFEHVESVNMCVYGTNTCDADLIDLQQLRYVQDLCLNATWITDRGLEKLKGLNRIKYLQLSGTRTTDSGLKYIKDLSELEFLDLTSTGITDAGLEHLKGLSELRALHLLCTKVTSDGVRELQQALPGCDICR